MTKFKKVLFVFLGVYIFTALSLAQAQNTPGPDNPSQKWHNGQRIQEVYSQLNLTDDQKKQLEANKQGNRQKMKAAWEEIKTNKAALHEELMKLQLDMPKINGIENQIKVLQSQMEDDKLSSILAVRSILTPDQFLKFINLMHNHKQEHDESSGHEQ